MDQNNIVIKKDELERIEKDLQSILKSERKTWIEFYNECDMVQKQELWRGKYDGWTQFINQLAKDTGVHVSTIWKKISAGRTLNEYNNSVSMEERIDPENSKLTVESITLINDIVKNTKTEDAKDLKKDLFKKASVGELKKNYLREACKMVKAIKNQNQQNNHDNESDNRTKSIKENETNIKTNINAVDIIEALSKKDWLWAQREYKRFSASDNQPCYKLLGEFECRTGTSKKARRVDAMIVENHTADVSHQSNHDDLAVYLHGIEIKVSKYDLLGDHKMAEYTPYCNYFYIAVPEDLVDITRTVALKEWGIISIRKDHGGPIAEIVQSPTLNGNPKAISKAYQTVIQRSCVSK